MPVSYSFEATYEVSFLKPFFSVAGKLPLLAKDLYDQFSPRYFIAPPNIRALNAMTYGDLLLEISLFGGAGTIRIFGDRYSVAFTGLRTDEDADIFADCIELAEAAIKSTEGVPDEDRTTVNVDYKFEIAPDATAVGTSYTNKVTSISKPLDLTGLPSTRVNRMLLLELINAEDDWSCIVRSGTSARVETELLVNFFAIYPSSSTIKTVAQKKDHMRLLTNSISDLLGLAD